jgi:hypothetical protein
LFSVIKWRFLGGASGGICYGVHVNDMITIDVRTEYFSHFFAVLSDIGSLSRSQKIWNLSTGTAIWTTLSASPAPEGTHQCLGF